MSDVIALNQPMWLFSPWKATERRPNFQQSKVFVISNIHTCHQLKFDLGRSSTRFPSVSHKKIDT